MYLSNRDRQSLPNIQAPAAGSPGTSVPPPDGGWAWLIVFFSLVTHTVIDGIIVSYGILMIELLKDFGQHGKAVLAGVGSLMVGVSLMIGNFELIPDKTEMTAIYNDADFYIFFLLIELRPFVRCPHQPLRVEDLCDWWFDYRCHRTLLCFLRQVHRSSFPLLRVCRRFAVRYFEKLLNRESIHKVAKNDNVSSFQQEQLNNKSTYYFFLLRLFSTSDVTNIGKIS
jgi:hypothetical protein